MIICVTRETIISDSVGEICSKPIIKLTEYLASIVQIKL